MFDELDIAIPDTLLKRYIVSCVAYLASMLWGRRLGYLMCGSDIYGCLREMYGRRSLVLTRRTKYKTAQRRQYCSHQVTHAYSGCMARRLGGSIGDGPETVGCGDSGPVQATPGREQCPPRIGSQPRR